LAFFTHTRRSGVLADVGHLLPLERPGELAAACLDLLAAVPALDRQPDRTWVM
jgi:hypothetical protein